MPQPLSLRVSLTHLLAFMTSPKQAYQRICGLYVCVCINKHIFIRCFYHIIFFELLCYVLYALYAYAVYRYMHLCTYAAICVCSVYDCTSPVYEFCYCFFILFCCTHSFIYLFYFALLCVCVCYVFLF